MRVIGILLILAGLALGVLWPWVQINFSGREFTQLQFGDLRGPIPARQSFNLSENDNPVRIRFQASYKVGAKLPPVNIPVKVVMTDADGTLLTGIISFPTQGIESGPEQPKLRGSTPLNFDVINSGPHELFLELAENSNDGGILAPGINRITATVVANAPEIRDDYKALSAVLALAGFYLFIRSRRSKSRESSRGPIRRWGRGD